MAFGLSSSEKVAGTFLRKVPATFFDRRKPQIIAGSQVIVRADDRQA